MPDRSLLDDGKYRQLLDRHFSKLPAAEREFFVNTHRFDLFRYLMEPRMHEHVRTVLDVACGPFAIENYVRAFDHCQIDAFDIDENLPGLFRDLRGTNKFSHVHFRKASAEEYNSGRQYDLVLVNDLFYHKAVSFNGLIDRLAGYVARDGYLYFDILDKRSRWIWQLAGKDGRFARYDLQAVAERLQLLGFDVLCVMPSLGIGSGLNRTVRSIAYQTAGIANNYIFVARKR